LFVDNNAITLRLLSNIKIIYTFNPSWKACIVLNRIFSGEKKNFPSSGKFSELSGNTFPAAGDFPNLRETLFRRRETFRTFGKHFSGGGRLSELSGSTFPAAGDFPNFREALFRRRDTFRTFGKHFSGGGRLSEPSGSTKPTGILLPTKTYYKLQNY